MKPKNVMLLGFVNKAVEYLDKHMDDQPDSKLTELKNIDLASLRDELSDNLDISLGTMQSTMATLLRAGNEAFDKFIDTNAKKTNASLSEQFDRMFDVDFDDKKKNNQEELAKLLSFYNLDNDFGFGDDFEIEVPSKDNQTQSEDEFMQEIIKNATNDDVQDIMPAVHNEVDSAEIDSLFNEIVSNEDSDIVGEMVENAPVNNNDGNYVSSLIEELKQQMIKEDELIKQNQEIIPISDDYVENKEEEKEENVNTGKDYVNGLIDDLKNQFDKEENQRYSNENVYKDIYDRISKIYPYLPNGFIRSVYDLKETFAREYPFNTKIIIIHRIKFVDVENLRQFVEIGLSHGYTINADEKKMIVDIFREHINTDGKILTNIYEIANQGYLLNGAYDGYNVLINEDE